LFPYKICCVGTIVGTINHKTGRYFVQQEETIIFQEVLETAVFIDYFLQIEKRCNSGSIPLGSTTSKQFFYKISISYKF
jgi:hypothetical protein